MIYISNGSNDGKSKEIEFKHGQRPLMKSVSFFLLDREHYDAKLFLDVVWKHAGFLCIEVAFNHQYRTDDGQLSHTYDLYFQWGPFGGLDVTNDYINQIMWKIEQDMPNHFPCDLRGRDHSAGRSFELPGGSK